MKPIFTALAISSLAISFAQRSTAPWHNHTNYKQEQLEDIRNTVIAPQEIVKRKKAEAKPVQNTNNRVSIGGQDLFLTGTNVAWVNYGGDVGVNPSSGTEVHPDMNSFKEIFDLTEAAGGNSIRWWLHVNGSYSPSFDENQTVSGVNASMVADLTAILDAAWERGLRVQICLWSFDMLKDQWMADATANKKLFTDDDALNAYINNALLPMVNGLKDHPGLLAWEIFNEPEGMTEQFASGWDGFLERVTMAQIQKFVNKCAGAIHRADPNVIVTNGSWAMTAASDGGTGNKNYYTDAELIAAGGDQDGTLDIYNVHYYDWAGTERSPFHHDYAYWEFDKPTVIAEFHPEDTYGVLHKDLITNLYNNGYAGGLNWSYSDVAWSELKDAIEEAHTLAAADIDIDPNASFDSNTARFNVSALKICQSETIEFNNITEGSESYSWDFGDGAVPATFDGMQAPAVSYTTPGLKTISLSINNGGDVLERNVTVISSTSSYEATLEGTSSISCEVSNLTGEYNVSLTPSIAAIPSITFEPNLSAWDEGATQSDFTIASDGTIEGAENASVFLLGTWHDWSTSEYNFTGVFDANASISLTISNVQTDNENPSVTVSIDGISTYTKTFSATEVVEIEIPQGAHTVTVSNPGGEWIGISKYEFKNVGVSLQYEWLKNNTTIANETDESLSTTIQTNDKITAIVITGEIEECVAPSIESNTIEVGCVTALNSNSKPPLLSSANEGNSFVAGRNGFYVIYNLLGQAVVTLQLNSGDIFGENLEGGIYLVKENNDIQKILKK